MIKEDYYNISIKEYTKNIKLLYRIREYEKINKDELKQKRKNGFQIKKTPIDYYYLKDIILTPLENRKKIVKDILNLKHTLGQTLEEDIFQKWENKNSKKTTDTILMDNEAVLLDILASYYIGGYEYDDILDQNKWRKYQKYNIGQYDDELDDDNISSWSIGIMSKNRENNYGKNKNNKKKIKTWKKTKTSKLNALYSYNNHKDTFKYWNWIKNDFTGLDINYHKKYDRLINPEDKYISKWCYVNTENEFEFQGNIYIIDNCVEQYKYEYNEDKLCMDQILVIEQYGKIYYFDANIDSVESQYITLKEK